MSAPRSVGCAEALAELVGDGSVIDLAVRRHLDVCWRCRQELAGQRDVARLLAAASPPALPEGLLEDVLAMLTREAGSLRRRVARVAPYVGGVLAATAAGAALAAVSRRVPVRPAA